MTPYPIKIFSTIEKAENYIKQLPEKDENGFKINKDDYYIALPTRFRQMGI